MTRRAYQYIVFMLFLAALAAICLAFYFYTQTTDPKVQEVREAEAQIENILDAVGRHMVLPPEEEPTVATVSSLEPLAGQPFFANAKIGNKVLIYTKAKKAILYDPALDRIIEVAPLNIDAQ